MVLHANHLLLLNKNIAALSIAQDASALSHSMTDEIIQFSPGSSLTEEDNLEQYSVARHFLSSPMPFLLSIVTSSHMPPSWKDFRLPLNCLSLNVHWWTKTLTHLSIKFARWRRKTSFLWSCWQTVILFCNLARIHPEEFSSQFLWLLHAYAHFSHQDDSDLSLKNLRIFLEPNSDCPPPQLDRAVHIDDFNAHGGIIKDVVWAFYTCPSHSTVALIRNIFITHFDQAIIVLQEVVDNSDPKSSTIQWALYSIIGIIPFVSGANKMVLLQILSRTVKHTNDILTCQGSHWQWWLSEIHGPIFRHLWRAGLLEDALAELEQVIKYLHSCSDRGNTEVVERLWWSRMDQHFILCDMGRLLEAIQMIQQPDTENPEDDVHFRSTLNPGHPRLSQATRLANVNIFAIQDKTTHME
jgi:hypothetical protein